MEVAFILRTGSRERHGLSANKFKGVDIEDCIIGESETTGVAFANSTGTFVGNTIHHNDHGIALGGNSEVTLRHNVISHNLFEAVLMTDQAKATVIQNTFVQQWRWYGLSRHEQRRLLRGNIIGSNKVGLLFSPESQTILAFNALHDNQGDYVMQGTPHRLLCPQRAGKTDVSHLLLVL